MANEHSQIIPSMQPTAKVADFKFWCQKVLPLVYDDSLSYYEVLNKMVVYLNQVIDNINANIDNIAELEDDFLLLQEYVNNFFDDIDQLATYAERAEAAQTAAAGSALNAATSATNAATSASNAATSATNAASSSLNAMNARDAAIAAKTAAESALANAQTAATNAANSATAASNSATAASGSATNAAASATAAQQSFTLADTARQAAQTAAQNAQNIVDSIPEEYIEDVPAIVDKLNKVSSSNLYNPAEKEIGVINQDGSVTYNDSYITTGFIPVTPNYKIRSAYRPGEIVMYDANINRILLLDASMQIVSYAANVGTNIYDIPNNVYYVRCSFSASVESTLMIICEADPQNPSSYEPYANYFEATYAFMKTALDPLITNSIAPVLSGMIADTALVANDFRIANNTLYKITGNIASGGTLTPGTNCVATTIGEVLKTLLT